MTAITRENRLMAIHGFDSHLHGRSAMELAPHGWPAGTAFASYRHHWLIVDQISDNKKAETIQRACPTLSMLIPLNPFRRSFKERQYLNHSLFRIRFTAVLET
jgi:hypothetical protein